MKLYNTLTRAVEDLQPLNPPQITIYTCGPTVYDYAHIGHWFTYIRADLLVRALKSAGLQPKWVMNITDVGHLVSDEDEGEDKLEKGARREGKTAWEVAAFYTRDFLDGMQRLNIQTPDYIAKATDHIPEQIELIKKLETKGYTYAIDDGIYYDTSRFEGYTAFARLDLDEQQGSGRVAANPQKRSPSDFALWKFSPKDRRRDMEWDSPWGKGFPGWHIECSAMSMKYLGGTLDIHTGGIDHVPVHHTNEIAQSEATTGKRFALYWMHSNHVMVEGEKISKSLGNGIRLQEILGKGISAEAVRLHVLESHYRSQSHFSLISLDAAQSRLHALESISDLRFQASSDAASLGNDYFDKKQQALLAALQNDLDTPIALRIISEVVADLERSGLHLSHTAEFKSFLSSLDAALGFHLLDRPDLTPEQFELYRTRQLARRQKNWAASDNLRDQLKTKDIAVRDTPHGQIWSRFG